LPVLILRVLFGAMVFNVSGMTIWILAILLLAAVGAAGYQQGAIRGAVNFVGIILAAMLAGLAGKIFVPLMGLFGVKNPIWLWVLPPFLGFLLLMALVKTGAFFLHRKIDVYYKYKAGDLRLALWERLNARVGISVGLLNGVAYLVLLAFVINAFSYWTIQMSSTESDPKAMRVLNALGRDLQSTGMHRVGRAIDPLATPFYDTADLAGLLYQNPLLEARFLRYPGFLALGERAEFQSLGQDTSFAEMRLRSAPLREVLDQSSAKAVFANPELLREIWNTLQPDLADLRIFLETGKSAKYDGQKLLGRWQYDPRGSMLAYRRMRNVTGAEATRVRVWLQERFGKTVLVAAPDKSLVVKNIAEIKLTPGEASAPNLRTLKGTWQEDGFDYEFQLEGNTVKLKAKFEGRNLTISGDGLAIALLKDE
jgi:hypothetical protein